MFFALLSSAIESIIRLHVRFLFALLTAYASMCLGQCAEAGLLMHVHQDVQKFLKKSWLAFSGIGMAHRKSFKFLSEKSI